MCEASNIDAGLQFYGSALLSVLSSKVRFSMCKTWVMLHGRCTKPMLYGHPANRGQSLSDATTTNQGSRGLQVTSGSKLAYTTASWSRSKSTVFVGCADI